MIFHHVWPWFSPAERHQAASLHPAHQSYVHLRYRANLVSVAGLRQQRRTPVKSKHLSEALSLLFGFALLRFDFVYGDFMRWLSHEYTNRHRDWQTVFQRIANRPSRNPPVDQPPPDLDRAFRIFQQGVPLAGRFISTTTEIMARHQYDNHPAVTENADAVEEKFAKEEAKSFHIHLPRIFVYFLAGLLLSPLQWAMRKGKGRICVDCTNGPNPEGSPNSYIPAPHEENADECPQSIMVLLSGDL